MFHQYYKWIRCFHAVAKTGGFTTAARYLHIGQPTVTDQVKALEERFNVELFLRSGRAVRLTAAGEQLYAITQGLFGQEEEAMQFLQRAHKLRTGLVRVGAVSPPIALELARSFKRSHAGLDLTVSIGSEASTLGGLQDFDIDVGILVEPPEIEGLHQVPYRVERIVAVVPAKHPWARKRTIATRDIAGEPVILREPGSKTRHRVERACAQQGVQMHCVMEINSREAILHAVANGMGVGFVTQIECIPLPGLKMVEIDDDELSISYSLCCLAVRKDRPLIRALFEVAQQGDDTAG
ncbi:aminoethylphosphonate catabolism LysR family transcriptional regulator [Variovorax boronicumulans]|uniref:LysR substrate-binding domain-containing protein n=1 Tax=Variovorax boronicumulans TaxID=436515 RepID=UPI0027857DDB|nr:LysR substrate-binding domain-containing protein [Variovorax boronicumulans]MDP9913621.1 aminoethylphosphonate catabolism LysR family transcriptional regulator [Variovorax boronicumulans]